MNTYYPITPEEIADGARRQLRGEPCTVPVRELYQGHPMMSWGSPLAYDVIVREGKLYAVYKHCPAEERVFKV